MLRYALNLQKRSFFSDNYANLRTRRGFGFKKRDHGVFSLEKEVLKTIF